MAFEIGDIAVQPDRVLQVELVTYLFQSVEDLMCPSVFGIVGDHGIFYQAVVFPHFSP